MDFLENILRSVVDTEKIKYFGNYFLLFTVFISSRRYLPSI